MIFKKFLGILLSAALLFGNAMSLTAAPTYVYAEENTNQNTQKNDSIFEIISSGIGSSEAYLDEQLTKLHENDGVTYGFEWYIISMLRAGKTIDSDILEEYYASVSETVKTWTTDTKPTDIERTALALTSMKKDIIDVDGVNIAELIYNNIHLNDGSNELAYALIALDAANISIPETESKTKESMVEDILKFQSTDGGFGLFNNETSDVDMTAICLQALAPYQSEDSVKTASEKGIAYLKNTLSDEYNFSNANSTAQVLLALSVLNVDIYENGFGNETSNIITAVNEYKNPNGNGYMYNETVNPMTTVQIMQAYDAYRKAVKENISYWNFSVEGQQYNDYNSGNDSGSNPGDASADSVVVYVTIVSDGNIVKDKNNSYVAQSEVNVTDLNNDGIFTVNEALHSAHETYYPGGAESGYSTYDSTYGSAIDKLWGIGEENITAAVGYWRNNTSCYSLDDTIEDGDYLTAFNYYDTLGWSDAYSYFETNAISTTNGSSVTLSLKYISGYDYENNYAPIVSAYEGANVVFLGGENGIQKTIKTNSSGNATLTFPSSAGEGTYYVMAYADNHSIVPAVCKIVVTEKNAGTSGGSSSQNISVYIRVADPKGFTYLSKRSYSVQKNTSVYDLLKSTGLELKVSNSPYGVYVKSIEGLSEFDKGEQSGWMYRVNGKFSDYSSSLYTLSNGDYVEWLYTIDLGDDIGNIYTGSSGGGSRPTSYTVNFDTLGGSEIKKQTVSKNSKLSSPTTPTMDGYFFDGWYTDKEYLNKYDFNSAVISSFTLYAKWNKEDLTADKDNNSLPFTDVDENSWYGEAIDYVVKNNLFNGVTDTEFAPNENMTRAMLVTVLYRLDSPQKNDNAEIIFDDVTSDSAYYDAISWAAEYKIVDGITDTKFEPDTYITREQLATILYRYAKLKDFSTEEFESLAEFEDSDTISPWAVESMEWAVKSELINGMDNNTISPKDNATRAQTATIIIRFAKLFNNW